ncbi:AAA family ATPase, partial [bacterium]|nr:AAA family ATPase [bacterium]
MENSNFTPREIVSELDRYIISQDDAKKAVAIALRNRWRRQQVPQELRDEIVPKNIIMIGSTGIGKTEIARRLAKLAKAPFIKVEASKFTEVGYVGKDVESIIRDLTDLAVKMVREEETKKVKIRAQDLAEEKLLDLLLPAHDLDKEDEPPVDVEAMDVDNIPSVEDLEKDQKQRDEEYSATREKLREMLHRGELNEREVTLHPRSRGPVPMIEVISSGSIEEVGMNLKDMFSNIFPQGSKQRKMKVQEALEFLAQEESQ